MNLQQQHSLSGPYFPGVLEIQFDIISVLSCQCDTSSSCHYSLDSSPSEPGLGLLMAAVSPSFPLISFFCCYSCCDVGQTWGRGGDLRLKIRQVGAQESVHETEPDRTERKRGLVLIQ